LPATGFTHVVLPAGQAVWVLTLHELCTQGSPAMVTGWHVPHTASGARAQKVDAHWASSPHGPPCATVPTPIAHAVPRSPDKNVAQERALIDCAHVLVRAGVALVPVAPKLGVQFKIQRALMVARSPYATFMTNIEQLCSFAQ
jgi:hypothetical protein